MPLHTFSHIPKNALTFSGISLMLHGSYQVALSFEKYVNGAYKPKTSSNAKKKPRKNSSSFIKDCGFGIGEVCLGACIVRYGAVKNPNTTSWNEYFKHSLQPYKPEFNKNDNDALNLLNNGNPRVANLLFPPAEKTDIIIARLALGFTEQEPVTNEQVKRSYHQLQRAWHPDKTDHPKAGAVSGVLSRSYSLLMKQ